MNKFENFFNRGDAIPEKKLIESKENETSIFKSIVEQPEVDWVEVEASLHQLDNSLVAKMSDEKREELKESIAKAKEIFASTKDSIDKDLVEPIEKRLEDISQYI